MPKKGKRVKPENELKHVIGVRVSEEIYRKVSGLLPYTPRYGMSLLLRRILENRPIHIFVRGKSMDPDLIELNAIRQQIKSTGRKINEYTRLLNAAQSIGEQGFYAKLAFSLACSIEPEIDRLLDIVLILKKRYLDENSPKETFQLGNTFTSVLVLADNLAAAADQQQFVSWHPFGFGASQ